MTTNFNEFALHAALQSALTAMNFETPTPIQAMAIPFALEGRDILGSAQTGTGKTAAFCVPMINFLMNNPQAHALVMLPTRELASQVHDVARKMIGTQTKGPEGIKTALLIGGEPIGKQYAQLDRRPRLIVGTPGRINDHLRGNPDLVDRVSFVVLDEADRMLDMGFAPQIDSILSETALERQTLMFSATFPDNIIKFSKQYLQNPERVSAGVQSKPGENIIQDNIFVEQPKKFDALMEQLTEREGSVIVFARTQVSAERLSEKLNKNDVPTESIHGGLRQRQRDKVIRMFRNGEVRVLVATDVAARGLDVPHIEHVVNYDLPQVAEDYIHRIGRTARAGAKGHAISFISSTEKHLWRDIERMLNPNAKDSDVREGGYGRGKKPAGGRGGKPFGKKPYGERSEGRKEGGFKARKPFGRADRKDRKEGGWNPDADFANQSSEHGVEGAFDARPRREYDRSDRPQRSGNGFGKRNSERSEGFRGKKEFGNRDGGFKKPFQKRERSSEGDFASNPDSYKRTNSAERRDGGFKKPFKRDGAKPFREDGFKKPYNRDGASSDRPRSNYGDRPQRAEGGRSEGGFKKPYNRDGAKPRTEGGFKKPYNRDGASSDRPRSKTGDRPFVKREGGARSEGSAKKSYAPRGDAPRRSEGGRSDRPRSASGPRARRSY
jgi:superfamily II DNA/RNA helicase